VFFHTGGAGHAVARRPGHDLVTLEQVNAMSEEQFAETFGDLVQEAPWMLDAAFAERPFADAYALRGSFQDALLTGTPDQQLSLLQSFPDLGSDEDTAHRYVADHEKVIDGGSAKMANSVSAEKATALIEVSKILDYRFDEKVADANPIASSKLKLATELSP
jgi:uric acid transporter